MAYVGREPRHGFLEGQTSTFNGSTTTVTLQRNVSSTDAIDVYIDNVHQEPDVAYTLSSGGDSITFTGTPENGAKLYVRFHGITFDTARANRLINTDGGSTATLADNDTFTMSLDGTTVISASSSGVTIPNLTVTGTTTSVNSTNLEIGDNKITLNSDVASNAAPSENAGITINRGSSADVDFIWNETNDEWYAADDLATGGIFRVKGTGSDPTYGSHNLGIFRNSGTGDAAKISIIGNSGTYSRINFGDENDDDVGQINYSHTTDAFSLNKGLGVTGNINVSGGSASAPAYTFSNDTNTGMFRTAANTLGFSSGGTEYVQLGSFGVAADQFTNKTAGGDVTIDAAGDIVLDADGGDVALHDGGTAIGRLGLENGDLNLVSMQQDYDVRIKGNDGGSIITALQFDMSEAGRAIFNAGLLSNNTNDIRKAQITSQYDSSSFLRLHPSATTNSGGYTNMFFGTSTDNNYGVAIGGVREGTDGTPSFAIRMHNDSIVGTKVLTIDSMGRTGIGKVPASSTGSMLQIEGNDGIAFRRPNQTNHFVLRPLSASGGDGMRFTQEGVGDRMFITSGGNVGIGIDPQVLLHVQAGSTGNGTVRIGGGAGLQISHDNSAATVQTIESLYRTTNAGANLRIKTGHLTIFTGTSGAQAMDISETGNVDIAGVLTNDAKRIIDHPTQTHALAHYQELVCHNALTTSQKNTWVDVAFTGHSCIFKVYGATLENGNNALGGARLITNMLVTYGHDAFTTDAYKVTAMNGGGISSLEYRYLNSGGNAGSHRLQARVNWSTSNTMAVYTTITGMSETLSVAEDN